MSAPDQTFMSTVMGTLDGKGRVCIPAAYRQILAAQNTNGVYVCQCVAELALEAFGSEIIQTMRQRLAPYDPFFSPLHDDEARAMIARTHLLPADEQGRVRLPDGLIAYAGLKDKVAFVGMSSKFQIWDAERQAAIEAESLVRNRARYARERAQQMGEGGA